MSCETSVVRVVVQFDVERVLGQSWGLGIFVTRVKFRMDPLLM